MGGNAPERRTDVAARTRPRDRQRRGRARRTSAGALRRRAAAVAGATRTLDGKPAADRGPDQAGAHDRPGRVHRTQRDELDLVGPAPGPRALAQRLRKTVPDGCRRRRGDDGGMVRTGGQGRDHHLPGRRHRRRRGPGAPPGTVAEGAGHEVARARQSRRRPGRRAPLQANRETSRKTPENVVR